MSDLSREPNPIVKLLALSTGRNFLISSAPINENIVRRRIPIKNLIEEAILE